VIAGKNHLLQIFAGIDPQRGRNRARTRQIVKIDRQHVDQERAEQEIRDRQTEQRETAAQTGRSACLAGSLRGSQWDADHQRDNQRDDRQLYYVAGKRDRIRSSTGLP